MAILGTPTIRAPAVGGTSTREMRGHSKEQWARRSWLTQCRTASGGKSASEPSLAAVLTYLVHSRKSLEHSKWAVLYLQLQLTPLKDTHCAFYLWSVLFETGSHSVSQADILCNTCWPGTQGDPPTSASWVLELQVWSTMASLWPWCLFSMELKNSGINILLFRLSHRN